MPSDTGVTKVLLVRHAQTALSKDNRYTGASDLSLNDIGVVQAESLSKRLGGFGERIVSVYSSSLKRSMETADIIAKRLSLPVHSLSEFNELNYGLWEGLTRKEVLQRFPEQYQLWANNSALISPPDGESGEVVVKRARIALDRLVIRHVGETIVIVAHKAVNRLLICSGLGVSLERSRQAIEQDEACLNVLAFEAEGMRLMKMNDTSHWTV